MIFNCPECDARVRGSSPGSIVACGRCSSPVVVPEAPPAEPPPRERTTPAPQPSAPEPWTPQKLWGTAGGVVLILAIAHVALFLVLTMGARAGIREIQAEHLASELAAAKRPAHAPTPGSPEFSAWSQSVELWESAQAWRVHKRHVMLLRTGLVLSFVILFGITAWGVFNLLRRRPMPQGR